MARDVRITWKLPGGDRVYRVTPDDVRLLGLFARANSIDGKINTLERLGELKSIEPESCRELIEIVRTESGAVKRLSVQLLAKFDPERAIPHLDWLIERFFKQEKAELGEAAIFDLFDAEAGDTPPGADHLIITPWLLGERCPVASTTTRGTIFNVSLELGLETVIYPQ